MERTSLCNQRRATDSRRGVRQRTTRIDRQCCAAWWAPGLSRQGAEGLRDRGWLRQIADEAAAPCPDGTAPRKPAYARLLLTTS